MMTPGAILRPLLSVSPNKREESIRAPLLLRVNLDDDDNDSEAASGTASEAISQNGEEEDRADGDEERRETPPPPSPSRSSLGTDSASISETSAYGRPAAAADDESTEISAQRVDAILEEAMSEDLQTKDSGTSLSLLRGPEGGENIALGACPSRGGDRIDRCWGGPKDEVCKESEDIEGGGVVVKRPYFPKDGDNSGGRHEGSDEDVGEAREILQKCGRGKGHGEKTGTIGRDEKGGGPSIALEQDSSASYDDEVKTRDFDVTTLVSEDYHIIDPSGQCNGEDAMSEGDRVMEASGSKDSSAEKEDRYCDSSTASPCQTVKQPHVVDRNDTAGMSIVTAVTSNISPRSDTVATDSVQVVKVRTKPTFIQRAERDLDEVEARDANGGIQYSRSIRENRDGKGTAKDSHENP